MTNQDDRPMDEAGRRRIAEFVHAALGWAGANASKNFSETRRVSKTTMDRVKRGEVVSDTYLRAVGDVMGLPRDYLLYIGYADLDRLSRLGETSDADRQDLVRWTLEHLFPDFDNPCPSRATHTA
jgi:hypothetical protein